MSVAYGFSTRVLQSVFLTVSSAVPFLLITRTTTYLSRYCTIMHLYLILSFISALKLQFSTHMERFPIPLPSHKNRNFQKE